MRLILLSKQFYEDYADCPEIERKENRPHLALLLEVDGCLYAVPFRSNIQHKHAFFTDKKNNCGLDYSKTVVITKTYYISDETPTIRQNEYAAMVGREHQITRGLVRYIDLYKRAKENPSVARNRLICQYSALQYFEEFI